MTPHEQALRGLWLAVIMLTGLVAAVVSGLTLHSVGADAPAALTSAVAVFVDVVTLGMAARKFMKE